MPIRKMMAAHPAARGHINEPLAQVVRQAIDCTVTCLACADACAAEEMDMRQCIRTCLDCADACDAAMKLAARQTGANDGVLRAILTACIEACEACATECDRHDHQHCRLCAQACRQCADDCREALAGLG